MSSFLINRRQSTGKPALMLGQTAEQAPHCTHLKIPVPPYSVMIFTVAAFFQLRE